MMRSSMLHKTVLLILYFIIPVTNSWQLHPATRRDTRVNLLHQHPQSLFTTSLLAVTMPDGAASNEAWTKPRLHNTGAFRSMAILGAIAAAGLSSNSPFHLLSAQSMAALHLFSFATWFGTMVYTTFILGITMFKNLPRKTFGNLQAKLFPMYFALSSIAIILQVSASVYYFFNLYILRFSRTMASYHLQIVTLKGLTASAAVNIIAKSTKSLIVALVMTLLNQFIIEPMTTNNMLRRYELEDTENGKNTDEYKALKANFGKFHGISSLTNLVALCAAAAHGFYLSAAFI